MAEADYIQVERYGCQHLCKEKPLWKQSRGHLKFIRWAGLSGALAIYFAAKVALDTRNDMMIVVNNKMKLFIICNLMHFFHTLVLLAMPLARRPAFSGCLFLMGMMLFCGGCYSLSIFNENLLDSFVLQIPLISPTGIGGIILFVAWLSLLL